MTAKRAPRLWNLDKSVRRGAGLLWVPRPFKKANDSRLSLLQAMHTTRLHSASLSDCASRLAHVVALLRIGGERTWRKFERRNLAQ
jgi:hypothetical protein